MAEIHIEVDYDLLNDQAKILYDAARRKGYLEGQEHQMHRSGVGCANGMLDLATSALNNAVVEGVDETWVTFALMSLSRTPQMNIGEVINAAIDILRVTPSSKSNVTQAKALVEKAKRSLQ